MAVVWTAGLAQASPGEIPQTAIEAYGQGDYERAADLLEETYISGGGGPGLLYAWAQAERMAGDCVEATRLYKLVLEAELTDQDRLAAESGLRECEKETTSKPPPTGSHASVTRESRVNETPAGPAPWYRRGWVTASVIGVGAVGLGLGGGLYWNARQVAADASDEPDAQAYLDALDRAERRRNWAVISAGAGGAFLAAGLVLLLLGDEGGTPAPSSVSVSVTEGARAMLRWRF